MNTLVALIAPSCSGKSTLINELVARHPGRLIIVPSLTTRASRGEEDAPFYRFVTRDTMLRLQESDGLLQMVEYAGELYSDAHYMAQDILSRGVGIKALVEQGVLNWRAAGHKVVTIRIVPERHTESTNAERLKADAERPALLPTVDLTVVNSFAKGGKQRALDELEKFLLDSVL